MTQNYFIILILLLYIDNLTYLGEEITSSNYLDYTNIDLSEEAKFSKSNIKINTLIEEE